MMYRHILVALDGSVCAERALDEALKIAAHSDAEITAVYVAQHVTQIEDIEATPQNQPPLDEAALEKAGESLARARRRCYEQHVRGVTRIMDAYSDTIVDVLARAAAECGADLVVMGTHGRSGVRHFLAGSVAESFIRIARVPVLLVRHDG